MGSGILGFIIGLFLGAVLTITILAIMSIGKDD